MTMTLEQVIALALWTIIVARVGYIHGYAKSRVDFYLKKIKDEKCKQ